MNVNCFCCVLDSNVRYDHLVTHVLCVGLCACVAMCFSGCSHELFTDFYALFEYERAGCTKQQSTHETAYFVFENVRVRSNCFIY